MGMVHIALPPYYENEFVFSRMSDHNQRSKNTLWLDCLRIFPFYVNHKRLFQIIPGYMQS